MFISKSRYLEAKHHIATLERTIAEYQKALDQREATIQGQQHEIRELIEARTRAQILQASSQAYGDVWRSQINQLQEEKAMLMARAFPGMEVRAPQIVRGVDPGTDFEDMGDSRAALEGLADQLPIRPPAIPDRPLVGRVAAAPLDSPEQAGMFNDANEE